MNQQEVERKLIEIRSKGIGPTTLITTGEVAKLLRVSGATVKRWADNGALRFSLTVGGHRRFMLKDVAAFELPPKARRQMKLPIGEK